MPEQENVLAKEQVAKEIDIPRTDTTPQVERQKPRRFSRGSRWTRVTLALTAAALAAACTTQSSEANAGPPDPNTIPQIAQMFGNHGEAPAQATIRSADQILQNADHDPNQPHERNIVDLNRVQASLHDSDYTQLYNTDGRTSESSPVGDYDSAPVMDLRYDQQFDRMLFQDHTSGLPPEIQYQLLNAIMTNGNRDILKTGLQTGKIDRIAVRQFRPNELTQHMRADEFVHNDNTDPVKGPQKTIFLFLPGGTNIDPADITHVVRHETIHGLTSDSSLSVTNADIKPEEMAQWQGICSEMRNAALEDAKKYQQQTLQDMDNIYPLIKDPRAKQYFDEVRNATRSGELDRFQPHTGDTVSNFSAKIPECRIIGPWQSYVRLLAANDLTVEQVLGTDENTLDRIGNLMDNWSKLIQNQNFFSVLREGTYETAASDKTLGHPQDNWDELSASVDNTVLLYPEAMGDRIKVLPPQQREVAIRMVEQCTTWLDRQVPPDQTRFHTTLDNSRNTFRAHLQ